ncbi:UV radiation resistance protein and autophagy-related subunit 14-domain-containing protein [Suillus subluteus]|nr:UV radiation resistance protein and autophagy-related subunit 14-domain-containing protein [Suillus subluteus]
MECKNCEMRQCQYHCANCLKNHLHDFRLQTHHFPSDKDEYISRASRACKSIESGRLLRAKIASEKRLQEQARPPPYPTGDPFPAQAHASIARARSGLVQELAEVFHVVASGGRQGARGEWTIGGLVLPVPGDVRRDHINAAITYTVHFLGLLTFYLGIKLPFEVSWSCRRLGVGMPWIRAGRGSESWAKWTAKHPLHLTSNSPSTSSSPSSSPSRTPLTSLAGSEAPEQGPAHSQNQSFMMGLAMLFYNVAHTQGVDIPLSQAGDALSNLWAVRCSGELGR